MDTVYIVDFYFTLVFITSFHFILSFCLSIFHHRQFASDYSLKSFFYHLIVSYYSILSLIPWSSHLNSMLVVGYVSTVSW